MHCLDWVHIPHWMYLMPGVYTLLLAVLAGVVPTLERYKQRWVKITYGVVLGMLCLLEVASISNDRRTQETKHDAEMELEGKRFDKVVQLLQGIQSAEKLASDAVTSLATINQQTGATQAKAADRQLKVRLLDLARDIGEFVTNVRMLEIALPTPTTHGSASMTDPAWKQWEAQLENIEHNAIAQYHFKFGASVTDIVEQAKKRGIWVSPSDCEISLANYTVPATSQFLYVMGCAQDLQRSANNLP